MKQPISRRPLARRHQDQQVLFRFVLSFAALGSFLLESAFGQTTIPLKVPEGFEVTLFADDDMAHDIYCMTIDAHGRVVVSGAGYVRVLVDQDGDGRADEARQFVDGPKTGAQGMFFHGTDLLCIGDGGLLRYRDADDDDQADGPPEKFLDFLTGSEHHTHSIQRGPDGWWYIIAGNNAEITRQYATLPSSPVKEPQAGTLLRLTPDLTGGEVFANGFRNAYDFAFNWQGDLFTFDSDGEREVSLPWYRPTRVFHVLPGSHAGWFSRSWKRPDYFLDMPPVVASFGRGSPTGVVSYRHHQFPEEYRDALFVLDWTFGRVMAVPLERDRSTWKSRPIEFMTGTGQFGFAPTDAEVGPDGSLYVSVGGRGTRGGVYRVRYTGEQQASSSDDSPLEQCLNAPQPLSSWSRATWTPIANELGKQPFVDAAVSEDTSSRQRIRAIEIVTEMFGGFSEPVLLRLADATPSEVRARAIWSYGRSNNGEFKTTIVARFLSDNDPIVGRFAVEALLGASESTSFNAVVSGLIHQLNGNDRYQRFPTAQLATKMNAADFNSLAAAASATGWKCALANSAGFMRRETGFIPFAFEIGLPILQGEHPASLKLDAIRLMQIGLGDVGPMGKLPPVFDGYAARVDLSAHEREIDPVRIAIADAFPTGDRELDWELGRLAAMITPYHPGLLEKLLAQIDGESHPVDDTHYLIVTARLPVERSLAQREKIATALVNLQMKIDDRSLNQDSNWDERVSEMYTAHVLNDPALPIAVVSDPSFGQPSHVVFLKELPEESLPIAIAAFDRAISEDPDYEITNDVVFILGKAESPRYRKMIRDLYDDFSVRPAVLVVLSEKPEEQDRQKFVEGLESSQLEVLEACLNALSQLPVSGDEGEQVALVKMLRRLRGDKSEYRLRETLVRLLQRGTGQEFGFEFGSDGYRPQPEVVRSWSSWMESLHPVQLAGQTNGAAEDADRLKSLLSDADWEHGNSVRGEALFRKRSCAQCHGGRVALGPDLKGVAARFSRDDLFTAIAVPNRDVSPRYQTTLIETKSGQVYSGLIIYESVDGVLLRNATNQTIRVEAADIETKRKLPSSLMPGGLLKDLTSRDLADLYAYLASLSVQQDE